jgi:hypothetical protein
MVACSEGRERVRRGVVAKWVNFTPVTFFEIFHHDAVTVAPNNMVG